MPHVLPNHWKGNRKVIDALRAAKAVTVPSAWVALNIARNMHIRPTVVPHGINWQAWQGRRNKEGYVLWNKGRDKDVCDPRPVTRLARRFTETQFVSTFVKDKLPNIRVTGRLPFPKMKQLIQGASVYLSTTKETFGIGTLEAMASGCPILGYDWGGNSDIVTHKKDGWLAEPGDTDGLIRGLEYCIEHRVKLGKAARETAKAYTWDRAVEMVANVYQGVMTPKEKPGVTVVIPSFNYSEAVPRAIQSALSQTLLPRQIIVVDDGSPDQGATKRAVEAFQDRRVRYVRQANSGVANARNHGIALAQTEYICCLDADDRIAPTFLEVCARALDGQPLLGVAYTGLLLFSADGRHQKQSGWPPQCNFDQQLNDKNQVPTCCVFRRRAWREVGGYRQRYAPQGCGTEDAAFWLSLGANGWHMRRVTNDPLFLYSLGGRTWNKKNYVKTNWTAWHPYTKDKRHPFASIATPNPHATHPVTQLDRPVVSVVTPVGPGHTDILTDALDSLEAQTFRKWESIVVNDSGEEIDLTAWPYVHLVETPGGKGAGYARNRGTEIAKGKYIVYLDADDFLQSNALERFIAAARQYPDTWVYPDMYTHRGNGELEYYGCSDFNAKELWRKGIAPVTCLYTKKMWEKVGGFDEESHREDWEFHLRLASAGICGIRLPEPLLTYRHSTGTRRASGSIRREAALLHEKYNQEELMKRCGGCQKRARMKKSPPGTPQAPGLELKEGDQWVLLEFTGNNRNDMHFRGKGGRRYIAGNNNKHRMIRVHAQDAPVLLRMKYFTKADTQAQILTAQKEPKKAPKPEKPSLDIVNITVAQLRETDLTGHNLNKLIKAENARTPSRSTVLRHLRAEKQRRMRRRNG
jgi:glycosyltransferase involved in cell wall biosynthesis